ncbi:hypothetical protein J7K18_01510 [bacterium]|nr:hypothetical protein [bacterium]
MTSISLWGKTREFCITGCERVALPDPVIEPSSIKILCKPDSSFCPFAFILDSSIIVIDSSCICDTVCISYNYLPVSSREFAHRSIDSVSGVRAAYKPPTFDFSSPDVASSGQISRAITVGTNRSPEVDGELSLFARGKLSRDVHIVASISDRTSPIQPEGTTEELEEIDKLFIKFLSPHFVSTFGDFDLKTERGYFLSLDRRLKGVMGNAKFSGFDGEGALSVQRGEFASVRITPEDGVQGPYEITPQGATDVVVVAGSERVWFDGRLIKRGENNDYIIDYSSAQITFTSRCPVRYDSRIVVDFQYIREDYQKTLYLTSFELEPTGGLRFIGGFARETDETELSHEEQSSLSSAGDNPDSAYILSYTESDSGDYILVDSHFVYVGGDTGSYVVTFYDMGEGNGEYIKEGEHYSYIGEGGRYSPRKLIPLPESAQMVTLGAEFSHKEVISAKAEYGISTYDMNSASKIDDGDNTSDGFRIKGELAHSGFTLAGEAIRRNRRFHPLSRLDDADEARNWGISTLPDDDVEMFSTNASWQPFQWVKLTLGYGELSLSDTMKSKRSNGELNISTERFSSRNNLNIGRVKASYSLFNSASQIRLGAISTGFSLRREETGKSSRLIEYSPEISLNLSGINQSLGFTHRRQDRDGITNYLIFDEVSYSVKGKYKSFSANSNILHRKNKYAKEASLPDNSFDLAYIELSQKLGSHHSARLRYNFSNTQTACYTYEYIEVPYGEGNYIFDPERNEFVPDAYGNYIRQIKYTGDFIPGSTFEGKIFLRGDTKRLGYRVNLISKKGTSDESSKKFILLPSDLSDSKNSLAYYNCITNIYLFHLQPASLELGYRLSRRMDAANITGKHFDYYTKRLIKILYRRRSLNVECEIYYERDRVDYVENSYSEHDISRYASELSATKELGIVEPKLSIGITSSRELELGARAITEKGSAGAGVRIGGISAHGEMTFSYVKTDYDGLLPYGMLEGNSPGENLRWEVSIRSGVVEGLSLVGRYWGKARKGNKPEHFGNLSARYSF